MPTRSPSKPIAHLRAKAAGLTRSRPADDPELVDVRQRLKAARLESDIREMAATWPPLNPDQRDRLALLLRGGAA